MISFRGLAVFIIGLVVSGGCRSTPKEPPTLLPPQVSAQVFHYTGTPLSGPRAAMASIATSSDAINVRVTFIALDQMPAGGSLQPLGGRSRLITAERGDQPLLTSARALQGTLVADGAVAGGLASEILGPATLHHAPLAQLQGMIPPKVTAVFTADAPLPSGQLRRRVGVRLCQNIDAKTSPTASKPIQVALTIEQYLAAPAAASQPATRGVFNVPLAPGGPTVITNETAIFDHPAAMGPDDRVVLFVPSVFRDSPARVLGVLIDLHPPELESSGSETLARCQMDLRKSAELAAQRPDVGAVEGSSWAGYDSALREMWRPQRRRAALAFLASQTEAHLCEDTVLVADPTTLETLAATIADRAAMPGAAHTAEGLAWVLDRSAFELLAAEMAGEKNLKLSPELSAVLSVYAGQAGRNAASLDEIVKHLSNRQDLDNHLIAENLVFLTDASPAARVRAFDWLKARGRSPAGYDPLGPTRQRRDALDKAMEAAATQP